MRGARGPIAASAGVRRVAPLPPTRRTRTGLV